MKKIEKTTKLSIKCFIDYSNNWMYFVQLHTLEME